jgi:hypothetical protein
MKNKLIFLWHKIICSKVFYVSFNDGDESFLTTYNDCLYMVENYHGEIKIKK